MDDDIDWAHVAEDFHPAVAASLHLRHRYEVGAHDMMDFLDFAKRTAPFGVALFNSAIFLDSLRYKFTDHPKTQEIFGRLDAWAASLGAPGLFGHGGLFSQYVIGSAEFAASALLLAGAFLPGHRYLQVIGAALGLAIMTGAISFHLFTPLGVDPNRDGGGLFKAACLVWVLSAALLVLRAPDAALLVKRGAAFFAPAP